MNWRSASDENPGWSVYHADDPENPNHLYVIQKKRETNGLWKLAHRESSQEPLRIIYVGTTLKECKAYADEYRQLHKATEKAIEE